jgi:hypothetical protein
LALKKPPPVGAQHLDGQLRRHRPHGQQLGLAGLVFHHWLTFFIRQGLTLLIQLGLLPGLGFQRLHLHIG